MELVSMRCPQCLGEIKPVGNGYGKCLYCDGVFLLQGAAGDIPADIEEDDGHIPGDNFDAESWFAEYGATNAAEHLSETFFKDKSLANKKESRAREYFQIGDNEVVHMVLDTTILGSGKVGLACCTTGIFMKDEDGKVRYLNWTDVANVEIYSHDGTLEVDGSKFYCSSDCAELSHMFNNLKSNL